MQTMRETWTDERLDDFKERMDERFDHVERRMTEGFARIDADIRELRHAMVVGLGIMVTGFLTLASLIVL